MTTPTPSDYDVVDTILVEGKSVPGAMLPILHAIQDKLGYIPPELVPKIAEELNVSRAEVHGVITYYHHFRQFPPGRNVVHVCRAEACQSRGADALIAHVKAELDCDFHETSKDGEFTLEPIYCLGQCACGPAVLINDDLHARVSPEKLDRLLNAAKGAQ